MDDQGREVYKIIQEIRNYLAGRFVGATQDESLLNELTKMLFAFQRVDVKEAELDLAKEYRKAFSDVKLNFPSLFDNDDELLLDPASIKFIDEKFNEINTLSVDVDFLGTAFQLFVGDNVRGQSGQFFTPKPAVDLLVSMVQPKFGDSVLDYASGAGGFFTSTLGHLNGHEKEAVSNFYLVDKDAALLRLAKIHLALFSGKLPNAAVADSIEWNSKELESFPDKFDVILTNPPFGSKISSGTAEMISNYELGYKWKKSGKRYIQTEVVNEKVAPQVLFVEQAVRLLKDGGKLGIVLPESLVSSKKYAYVVRYLMANMKLIASIGMPEELFKTSGKSGTHTKTVLMYFEKRIEDDYPIFMAEASWVGHDSRANKIDKNDLPTIQKNYEAYINGDLNESSLGFVKNKSEIENDILAPRYYNPLFGNDTTELEKSRQLVSVEQLIKEGVLSVSTGDEVGKMAYGTGSIPFVRTSDISDWTIKADAKQSISEDYYQKLKETQDVQPGDILMVKDGSYLIGSVALVTEETGPIVYQSHILKFRVKDNEYGLTPEYLLVLFTSDFVKNQIRAKTLTLDIIDSLGDRYRNVFLPIHKNKSDLKKLSEMVKQSIDASYAAKSLAKDARNMVND